MRSVRAVLCALVVSIVTGCAATGPLYKEVASSFPPVPADKGRVVFYRADTMFGAAITSDIKLNGNVVGKSERASFFYVNEKPGNCVVSTATEVEKQLTFTLAPKETKYVRTSVSFGVLAGRINSELVSPADAKNEVMELHYTGAPKDTGVSKK